VEKCLSQEVKNCSGGKTLEKKWVLKYNCIAMDKINNVHDKLFSKTFGDPENVKDFLKSALPEPIGNAIDLSKIEIDNTHYVSNEFADSFSDIIVKTKMKAAEKEESAIDTDIYILFEHKSYRDTAVFIQLLHYMYLMWQKDIDEKKTLRVIIPLVFYHGGRYIYHTKRKKSRYFRKK